jgi:hypothetical protein
MTRTNARKSRRPEWSFSVYLYTTPAGREWFADPDIRMELIASNIKSFAALKHWMQKRYPFSADTKQELVQKAWAAYLEWSEQS